MNDAEVAELSAHARAAIDGWVSRFPPHGKRSAVIGTPVMIAMVLISRIRTFTVGKSHFDISNCAISFELNVPSNTFR